MNYDIISYILIGSLFTAIMIPLVALLRKSVQEQRDLDGGKGAKKPKTPQQEKKILAYP